MSKNIVVAPSMVVVGVHEYSVATARTKCGWSGDESTRWHIGSRSEIDCEHCLENKT